MSLGDNTKCDLSANEAIVDRNALIEVLYYTYHQLLAGIKKECDNYDEISLVSTRSKSLTTKVKQFIKTAELLHTIKESKNREIIEWID